MITILILFSLLLYITVTPNAVHALLALILLFIVFANLLFLTNADFLGFGYILVYIGAICVLFLYVILLLHLRSYTLMQQFNTFVLLALNAMFLLSISYVFVKINSDTPSFAHGFLNDLELFTSYLFKTHPHYTFLGTFLLLQALFLSVFLSTTFICYKKNLKNKIIL